jgi:hypothetical protein
VVQQGPGDEPGVCVSVKRDLIHSQKRPTILGIPGVCVSVKRDLIHSQKRPTIIGPYSDAGCADLPHLALSFGGIGGCSQGW